MVRYANTRLEEDVPYIIWGNSAKCGPIQAKRFHICRMQVGRILVSSYLKVGEVMQDGAEAVLAILNVLLGIQDMEMPKVINYPGRHDSVLRIFKTQNEKTAIFP